MKLVGLVGRNTLAVATVLMALVLGACGAGDDHRRLVSLHDHLADEVSHLNRTGDAERRIGVGDDDQSHG